MYYDGFKYSVDTYTGFSNDQDILYSLQITLKLFFTLKLVIVIVRRHSVMMILTI